MKNFIFSFSLLSIFSCSSNDIIIEEISFVYDNNNAQPSLVSDNGTLSLSWISSDEDMNASLYFRKFENEKWTNPQKLAVGSDWFVNWADFPTHAISGNQVLTSYLKKSASGTYTYDVYLNLQKLNGEKVKEDFLLNTDGFKAEHGFVSIVSNDNQGFYVTWLDGRNTVEKDLNGDNKPMTIRFAEINKEGDIIYETELDSSVCDCCQTSMTLTDKGPVVVYRDRSEKEVRDIYITRKIDEVWETPSPVHNDGWVIYGCPVNGPKVVSNSNKIAVSWFTVYDGKPAVNLSFSENYGSSFDKPIKINDLDAIGRVDVAFLNDTEVLVSYREGEIDTIMKPIDSIRYYKSFLRASMMSMEPQTGHVRAWVGGFNFKHFQYDQVKQGRRQIGSTFKPFLYATAIDQLKLSPCYTVPDALYCIEPMKHGNIDAWCPKNSSDKYGQTRNLKNALANSINTISARLMDQVGPKPVVTLMKKMGIKSYLPEVPSIALGTPDISLYEMVGAYSTFVNKGIYIEPIFITRIEDKNGIPLFEVIPNTNDVLSEEAAYVTLNLMEGVTQYGSGGRLRHSGLEETNYIYKNLITGYPYAFENSIAGKTGTTQNQSDGWFMGMVPNLVTGVWVGGEDRSVHFEDIAFGQGATMALPIWAQYMKNLYLNPELGISAEDFPVPEVVSIPLDCGNINIDSSDAKKDLEDLGF